MTARTWTMIAFSVIGFALASSVCGADQNAGGSVPARPAESTAKTADRPAHTDKPMAGNMKKKGMMQGDVKKAAAEWDQKDEGNDGEGGRDHLEKPRNQVKLPLPVFTASQ